MSELDQDRDLAALSARHYCVSFIDILGQRDAMRGQSLLPVLRTDEDKQQFYAVIKKSIGSIHWIQSHAEDMVRHLIEARKDSPLRGQLAEEQQATWDQIQATRITTQRWSDGVVSYVSLGDDADIRCPLNGLFGLIGVAGTHVLLGLVAKTPIRGAIELAWGVELRQGELYGPAIARVYELESSVAAYPRIVVGPNVIEYLRVQSQNLAQDEFSRYNSALARLCTGLLAEDDDGFFIVDYLGTEFRRTVTQTLHEELREKAQQYVLQQLDEHRRALNSKLAFRYARLATYFDARA